MASRNERNLAIIEEFRENKGQVGGRYADMPLLLLSTIGARTRDIRTNPLAYLNHDSQFIIFASKGGAPTNPDWFYNLKANPIVTVEVGEEKFSAEATILFGEERDSIFTLQSSQHKQFAEYQHKTTRTIPVVALQRIKS